MSTGKLNTEKAPRIPSKNEWIAEQIAAAPPLGAEQTAKLRYLMTVGGGTK
ncbi:hypothetical protein GCM10027417_23970 [Glutamicibacter endophyticus]